MKPMSRLRPTGPVTVAMTAFEIWRRLPPSQRQRVLRAARTHGPKVAAAILAARRRRLR
jgi:hypothetical protein